MFRNLRRSKQALPESECIEILAQQPRGVLAVHGEDGYPYALPMDYVYYGGKLYFHSAKAGHKIDAVTANDKVSFCVMDQGFREDGDWALNIKSVVVFGRISKIDDPTAARQLLRQLGRKYYPTPEGVEIEIEKAFAAVQMLELTIDHMTGKLVNES